MNLCGPFLVDELDDRWHQFGRDHHHGLIGVIQGVFDFRDLLIFGHVVVVFRQLADFLFGPAFWKSLFFHRFPNPPSEIYCNEPSVGTVGRFIVNPAPAAVRSLS